MFAASRLLSGTRHLLQRNALPFKVGEFGKQYHICTVPPRTRVSKGEFYGMSTALFLSMWAYPCWIMYHIPDYQQEDRNTYTGK